MKYAFTGVATVAVYIEVEADTPEAALAKAESAGLPSLCHECNGARVRGGWSLSDGLGDIVEDIEADPPPEKDGL